MTLITGKQNRNKGFALVEVLISFIIISCGIVFCLGSFLQSIRVSEKIEQTEKMKSSLSPVLFETKIKNRGIVSLDNLDPAFKEIYKLGE